MKYWGPIAILVVTLALASIFINILSTEQQFDPTIPTANQAGVIKNIPDLTEKDQYFVVQNLVYDAECSVYESEGTFVHRFPGQYCLFLKTGHFITHVKGQLHFYNSKMKLQWKQKIKVHHDLVVDEQRQEIAALHRKPKTLNGQSIVSHGVTLFSYEGQILFEWTASEHKEQLEIILNKKLLPKSVDVHDHLSLIKLNSVQIIPPNSVAQQNDAFRTGNLLLNDRVNSLFFVIDRSGRIVWSKRISKLEYRSGHSPRVLKNGRIVYFKNAIDWQPSPLEKKQLDRLGAWEQGAQGEMRFTKDFCSFNKSTLFYSKLIEFDPTNNHITWEYQSKNKLSFCSGYFSYIQILPNGNLLASHISSGGAAFELTRQGEIVWEWLAPGLSKEGHRRLIYKVYKAPKALINTFLSGQFE